MTAIGAVVSGILLTLLGFALMAVLEKDNALAEEEARAFLEWYLEREGQDTLEDAILDYKAKYHISISREALDKVLEERIK